MLPAYTDICEKLAHPGKHWTGEICLCINRFADVDIHVREDIVCFGLEPVSRTYKTCNV